MLKIKHSLIVVAAMLVSSMAMAVPAKRVKKTIHLADGTEKVVTLRGDETLHFYQAEDGSTYTGSEETGYKLVDGNALSKAWTAKVKARNARRLSRKAPVVKRFAQWGAATNPISGQKKGLVILVNFADKSLNSKHTQTYYNNFFNKVGFNEDGMAGSVHDYFYECSYGKFDLTFDVVGPVTVSKNMSFYGKNDGGVEGNDLYPATMVSEAVKLADKQGVDFSKYDWDKDGYVDQVYVIYAGYGEASGAPSNTIWPHEFALSAAAEWGDGNGEIKLDGVYIDTYACSNELCGTTGTKADGIGTACHEFSHCMCVPDMYDTNYTNFGMSYWDLLDAGCYNGPNGNGECPAAYTSYERMYCGWLTPTELKEGTVIKDMKPIETNPEAYIVYNNANRNEYYLLENHQLEGFDSYAFGHGMLVLHVFFDKDVWLYNEVNTTSGEDRLTNNKYERMTIIPADNYKSDASENQLAGDPWPGTKNKTALTDTSTPAAKLYVANSDGRLYMGKPITDIKEDIKTGTISFTFNGGKTIDAPTATEATNITGSSFTANWNKVADATSYEVKLTDRDPNSSNPSESIILNEDFSGVTTNNSVDISSSLNSYFKQSGWTGSKVYSDAEGTIKLGSGNSAGELITPAISTSEGTITIAITCQKYNVDASSIDVYVDGNKVETITPTADFVTYCISTAANNGSKISFKNTATKRRVIISSITVYDGKFSLEEITASSVKAETRTGIFRISSTKTVTTASNSYTFTNLDPTHKYSYQVRAFGANTTSDWSNIIQVTMPTAVITPVIRPVSTMMYDLSGRAMRNGKSGRGIYIKNGKKYIK